VTREQFEEAFDWTQLIGPNEMCMLLLEIFFPRFHGRLRTRLGCKDVQIDEAMQLYSTLKSAMPFALHQLLSIRAELSQILLAIKHVKEGKPIEQFPTPYG